MLSGVERGWELSILDNPGYGEANQEDMMQETETTMKTSSALLYVMDVGQLQDSEDARRLQQLHTADEGLFGLYTTSLDKTFSPSCLPIHTKLPYMFHSHVTIDVPVLGVIVEWLSTRQVILQRLCGGLM